jgi:hypothetical protein
MVTFGENKWASSWSGLTGAGSISRNGQTLQLVVLLFAERPEAKAILIHRSYRIRKNQPDVTVIDVEWVPSIVQTGRSLFKPGLFTWLVDFTYDPGRVSYFLPSGLSQIKIRLFAVNSRKMKSLSSVKGKAVTPKRTVGLLTRSLQISSAKLKKFSAKKFGFFAKSSPTSFPDYSEFYPNRGKRVLCYTVQRSCTGGTRGVL